jgi:cytochrome oxidase Cu insertion factor (SCO1/SenC/PrrC family)
MEHRRGIRAMRRGWFGLVSLCVMFGCLSPSWANPPLTPPAGLAASEQQVAMPTFRLPSVTGDTVDSATLHGKVVVVRFWATW